MPQRLESVSSRVPMQVCQQAKAGDLAIRSRIVMATARRRSPLIDRTSAKSISGVFICLAILCSAMGCATVSGEKYTSQSLPQQLVAAERQNPQTVDLTRLASSTASTDSLDRGDVLEMAIAVGLNEKDTLKMLLRIQDDGCADIPEIGRIKLAGLDITGAEATIVSEAIHRGLYRNPNITLIMKTKRMNRIMVAGAVKKPAIYELPRGQCDLLAALAKAEGLDPNAGTQVVIRNSGINSRSGAERIARGMLAGEDGVESVGHSVEVTGTVPDTLRIDLVSATKNGTGGYQLEDGAIVYVEKRDPEPLHVMGLVTKPGRFEFPIAEEVRVVDAVAMAGGVNSVAADKIYVIRRKPPDPNAPPEDPDNPDKLKTVIIQLSLANAKQLSSENIRLAPGDVVSVEQTPITFVIDRIQKTGFNFVSSVPLTFLGIP